MSPRTGRRLARALLGLTVCLGGVLAPGCRSLEQERTLFTRPVFTRPVVLAGQSVAAEELEGGRAGFVQYCAACHGMRGDGDGPASPGYRPPPRDLTRGLYKFGGVVDGLPHDEDFARILRGGLAGTPMLGWDIPDRELGAIIQYVKSLAPVWRAAVAPGTRVPVDTDPWRGRQRAAIRRGRGVYHGLASCQQCHPAYATRAEMEALSRAVGGRELGDVRPRPFLPEPKPSDYRVEGRPLRIVPPDFLVDRVRVGRTVEDLYRTISAGIPGTAMPTWYGALPAADVWAVAHYVRSLLVQRGTPAARALRESLEGAAARVEAPLSKGTGEPPER